MNALRSHFPSRGTRRDPECLRVPPYQFPPKLAKDKREASLVNSWWFLAPWGLICVGMLLARAWGYV